MKCRTHLSTPPTSHPPNRIAAAALPIKGLYEVTDPWNGSRSGGGAEETRGVSSLSSGAEEEVEEEEADAAAAAAAAAAEAESAPIM